MKNIIKNCANFIINQVSDHADVGCQDENGEPPPLIGQQRKNKDAEKKHP
jgi:hypothetical protein